MRIIKMLKEITVDKGGLYEKKLKAGKSYIFSDSRAMQLQNIYSEYFGNSVDLDTLYKKYSGQPLDGKTLFVWRHGGIGDLMFMLPPLRLLKHRYPTCKIWFASGSAFVDILFNIPYIDKIGTLPVSTDWLTDSDYHLHFEGIIEGSKEAETENAYDLFLKRFNIDPKSIPFYEKIPDVYLADNEIGEVVRLLDKHKFDPMKDTIIGIQLTASSPIRTYPVDKLTEAMRMLAVRGCKFIIYGHPAKHAQISKNIQEVIKDSTGKDDIIISSPELKLPLRISIATVKFLNLMIAPDSAFVHIAAAMHVPVIGLYGPFPSDLRMRYYFDGIGLNADTACTPCFTHGHDPCDKSMGTSPCFSTLHPETIVLATSYLLNKTQQNRLPNIEEFTSGEREFNKVYEECMPFMQGKGIDLGCGYTKHKVELNIDTADMNPLCDPTIIGNYFKIEPRNYDFVISSYVTKSKEAITRTASFAKDILLQSGYFILYVPDDRLTKNFDLNIITANDIKELFLIKISPEEIVALIQEQGFTLIKTITEYGDQKFFEDIDTPEKFKNTNFGFLTIWQKLKR
jgi:ADP-heptose:LPS heptosyltransferase